MDEGLRNQIVSWHAGGAGFQLSPQNIRYVLHVQGDVPHIDFEKGVWRCVGKLSYGYGISPDAAFNNWMDWQQEPTP